VSQSRPTPTFRAKATCDIGVRSWVMSPRSFLKSAPISKIAIKSGLLGAPDGCFRFSIFVFKQKLVAARTTTRESILALFGPPSFGAMSPRPKNTHCHEFCFTGFAYVVTKEIYLIVVNKFRTYSEYTRVSSKNRGTGAKGSGGVRILQTHI
jgi:hypothetical protein